MLVAYSSKLCIKQQPNLMKAFSPWIFPSQMASLCQIDMKLPRMSRHGEVRGQLARFSSPFPPCGYQGSNRMINKLALQIGMQMVKLRY